MANNESASTTPRYDVFISCKSEDYKYAEEIYDFLKSQGIEPFLASKELRRLGESEYRRAISNAMKSAKHIIVFASKAEYIDSTWVYYEWDMFINAKLKGFKPGNIVTILNGVRTDEINMDLWKYESMTYENYKDTLVQYVETEESRGRAEEIKKRNEREAEQRRKEEEERRLLAKKREELLAVAEEYHNNTVKLLGEEARIKDLMRQLRIMTRTCPACQSEVSINNRFCKRCGYGISPLAGIEGAEHLIVIDNEQLEIACKMLSEISDASESWRLCENRAQEVVKRGEEIRKLHDVIRSREEEIEQMKVQIKSLQNAQAHQGVTSSSGRARFNLFNVRVLNYDRRRELSTAYCIQTYGKTGEDCRTIEGHLQRLPYTIKTSLNSSEANELIEQLKKCGAKAEIVNQITR